MGGDFSCKGQQDSATGIYALAGWLAGVCLCLCVSVCLSICLSLSHILCMCDHDIKLYLSKL